MAHHVTLMLEPGKPFSLCFQEAAELIRASLLDLGRDCSLGLNRLEKGASNIILGYHLLDFEKDLKGYDYIAYQLEQLYDNEDVFNPRSARVLENAREVWDFSLKNIAFLEKRGIRAKHLPLGFHPALERIEHRPIKDIDVLFYGVVNVRRAKTLMAAQKLGARVEGLFGVYGAERDRYIARSRVVLNVHAYPPKLMETVRISYLLNNGCFLISEKSEEDFYPEARIVRGEYDELPGLCRYFLDRPDKIESVRVRTGEGFRKHYPMTELIRGVL